MRKLLAIIVLLASASVVAFAQAPRGPGAGHGYLIDKHVRAGLNCAACHADAPPPKAPAMTACLGCHGSYSDIAAKTAADQPNPHASHVGNVPCEACHHVHKASELMCSQCHAFQMNPP